MTMLDRSVSRFKWREVRVGSPLSTSVFVLRRPNQSEDDILSTALAFVDREWPVEAYEDRIVIFNRLGVRLSSAPTTKERDVRQRLDETLAAGYSAALGVGGVRVWWESSGELTMGAIIQSCRKFLRVSADEGLITLQWPGVTVTPPKRDSRWTIRVDTWPRTIVSILPPDEVPMRIRRDWVLRKAFAVVTAGWPVQASEGDVVFQKRGEYLGEQTRDSELNDRQRPKPPINVCLLASPTSDVRVNWVAGRDNVTVKEIITNSRAYAKETTRPPKVAIDNSLSRQRVNDLALDRWPQIQGDGRASRLRVWDARRRHLIHQAARHLEVSYESAIAYNEAIPLLALAEDLLLGNMSRDSATCSVLAATLEGILKCDQSVNTALLVCGYIHRWTTREKRNVVRLTVPSLDAKKYSEVERLRLEMLCAHAPVLALFAYGVGRPVITCNKDEWMGAVAWAQPWRTVRLDPTSKSLVSIESSESHIRNTLASLVFSNDEEDGIESTLRAVLAIGKDFTEASGLDAKAEDFLLAIQALRPTGRLGSFSDVRILSDFPDLAPSAKVILVNTNKFRPVFVQVEDQKKFLQAAEEFEQINERNCLTIQIESGPIEIAVGDTSEIIDLPRRHRWSIETGMLTQYYTPTMLGREEELELIAQIFRLTESERPGIVVYGNRRVGKTTLAWHALKMAESNGWIHKSAPLLDVFHSAVSQGGQDDESWSQNLAKSIHQRIEDTSGIPIPRSTNPLDVLLGADKILSEQGIRIGLLLDEFDSIFERKPGSPLARFVDQLGSSSWKALSIIVTIQNFSFRRTSFKTWPAIRVKADFSLEDAMNYFLPIHKDDPQTTVIDRVALLPRQVKIYVADQFALRPWFWAMLSQNLQAKASSVDGYAIAEDEVILPAIREVIRGDTFLPILYEDDGGYSDWERQAKGLLTKEERSVFACFAASGKWALSRLKLERHFPVDRGYDPIESLIEQEYLRLNNMQQVEFSAPVFALTVLNNPRKFENLLPEGWRNDDDLIVAEEDEDEVIDDYDGEDEGEMPFNASNMSEEQEMNAGGESEAT